MPNGGGRKGTGRAGAEEREEEKNRVDGSRG